MALGNLLGQVLGAISNHADQQQHTGFDPSNLLNEVQGLFQQHAANTGQTVLPASQDPYGDPADQAAVGYSNIRPASQDPMGDPADRMPAYANVPNVRPASEDPLGDPADAADRARGIRPASEDPLGDPADTRR